MIEIRFDKTKDEVALLIWFLVDHSVVRTVVVDNATPSTSIRRLTTFHKTNKEIS
jgi:hypothetical protein